MVEQNLGLARQAGCIESIIHQHEDVYVIGIAFCRHERSKNYKSRQVRARPRHAISVLQPLPNGLSWGGADREVIQRFRQRDLENPDGEIAVRIVWRQWHESFQETA